ncbi:MAG: HAMP domain-containing sensor histidine kinase [Bacillota bacterium]|nr:HAMP domain-containing sensor histidine kinase [Bacillota bacterium]
MKKSLFTKMVASYFIITAVSFAVVACILSLWFQNYYLQNRSKQLEDEAYLIKNDVINYSHSGLSDETIVKLDKLNETIKFYSSYSKADIWITDNFGVVYAVSNENQKFIIDSQVFYNDLSKLWEGQIVKNKGKFANLFDKPVRVYEIPIFDSRNLLSGIVIISTPVNELNEQIKKVEVIIWVSAIIAAVISSIAAYYFSKRFIIKPLAKINYTADKISKGEVKRRVNINSNDEIGELVKSFNLMADSMEKIEANRRLFVSNVSHEIRSPITSIKGFIGGILDGVIPPEKEKYYLNITFEEIQRLTRLVNDLLDLSAIESGKVELKNEKFDINEIIRICVIKFETKINSKNLKVDVCFTSENLYAEGDKDRHIQVVTNLLDNAIKYVGDGGIIKIESRIRGDKIQVSIFNNGACIPMEDLPHIWDRFYKAEKSRTTKTSTGLGLPIVRNILTQHGEDIWVENVEGEGVTFTFSLKPSI